MKQLDQLRQKWKSENIAATPADDHDIARFEKENAVILPPDIQYYFKNLNGTGCRHDSAFYEFYPLSDICRFQEKYGDYRGIPDYSSLIDILPEIDKYYAIADYSINLVVYIIKLEGQAVDNNEVLEVCGSAYEKVADSFAGFIDFYLKKAIKLF